MPHAIERFAPALPHLMQLKTLAPAISPRQIIGPLDRVVEGIAYDSRRVQRNFLFVALRGEKSDGHQFIEQAIEKGATTIVTEQEVQVARATCLVVENTRQALADLGAGLIRSGHRVLSHCGMGFNRSALVAGLILVRLGIPGCEAVNRLRGCRPGALFNEVFAAHLDSCGPL